MSASVLFIHPHNHPLADVIPLGSIAAMNLLSGSRLGRYAEEVSPEEIRAARMILIDLHWYFPLSILEGTVAAIRGINAEVPIVLGGITAAFYGAELLRRFDVDFVIGGHAELSVPTLADRLLAGESPGAMPGVWSRHHAALPIKPLEQQQFDALDWLTVDWFPTFDRRVREQHALFQSGAMRRLPDHQYPTLALTRGCLRRCHFCYGSYQDRVFGRGVLSRSPAALLADLRRIEADPVLAFATLYFSDGSFVARYAQVLDGAAFDLDAFAFICGVAPPAAIAALRSAFRGRLYLALLSPTDLAPLPNNPAAQHAAEQFAAMLARLGGAPRTWVNVWPVSERLHPSIGQICGRHDNIELGTAEGWAIVRPDQRALERGELPEVQLDRIIEASACLGRVHLLRALLPALNSGVLKESVSLPFLLNKLQDRRLDPFETRLLRGLLSQFRKRALLGFDDLQLCWAVCSTPGDSPAAWSPPGHAVPGVLHHQGALGGFSWQGEVQLDNEVAWGLAPLPTVTIRGEPKLDMAAWSRSELPTIRVAAGPRRTVEIGGHTRSRGLVLWVRDRAPRRACALAYPSAT